MKKVRLLTLAILIIAGACDSEEPMVDEYGLPGTYISLGGAIGLASGDSLIITDQQISWLDAEVNWKDNEILYTYNKPWVRVNYSIISDSVLRIDPKELWGGEEKSDYIYKISKDTIWSRCFSYPAIGALYLDVNDCDYYSWTCCSFQWNRQ